VSRAGLARIRAVTPAERPDLERDVRGLTASLGPSDTAFAR